MLKRLLPFVSDFAAWRDRLTLLIVALLPWQARYIRLPGDLAGSPWEQGTLGIFALEVLLLAALCCHLIAHGRKQEAPRRRAPMFLRVWALFLLYAVFSAFWAEDPKASLITWAHLFDGFALAYLVWISRRPMKEHLAAFLVGTSAAALIGLWQFFTQTTFASTWLGMAAHPVSAPGTSVVENAGGRFLRAYGPLPHPNVFGGFMAAALLAATMLYMDGVGARWRRGLLAIACLSAAGLVVSFSRSAWLAYVIVFVVASVLARRRMGIEEKARWRRVTIVQIVAAGLFLLLAWSFAATRLTASGRLESGSISERETSIMQGIGLFRRHYATGVGLGNMVPAAYEEVNPQQPAWTYQPAHLVPLLAAAELGFLGAALLIGAAFLWFLESRIVAREAERPLAVYAALAPLLVIIVGFFDHYPLSIFAGTMLCGYLFGLFLRAESAGEA